MQIGRSALINIQVNEDSESDMMCLDTEDDEDELSGEKDQPIT